MKKYLLLIIVLCLMILFFIWRTVNNETTSLFTAYEIANTQAQKWNKSANLYFATSVDDSFKSDEIKGVDGKRHNWNFDFVVVGTTKHLIITIHDKKIVNLIEIDSYINAKNIIKMEEIILSTKEAVSIASEKYKLYPGLDWAQGYHFVLESEDFVPYLTVVGLDKNGDITRINFNAKTKDAVN